MSIPLRSSIALDQNSRDIEALQSYLRVLAKYFYIISYKIKQSTQFDASRIYSYFDPKNQGFISIDKFTSKIAKLEIDTKKSLVEDFFYLKVHHYGDSKMSRQQFLDIFTIFAKQKKTSNSTKNEQP